jgi:hypothetical protein
MFSPDRGGLRWISNIIGIFIILIGIGLIPGPLNFWPCVLLIFLIRIGIRIPPADVAGGGRFNYSCIRKCKAYIWENGRPDIFRGFIRKRGDQGFPGDRPFQE